MVVHKWLIEFHSVKYELDFAEITILIAIISHYFCCKTVFNRQYSICDSYEDIIAENCRHYFSKQLIMILFLLINEADDDEIDALMKFLVSII